METGGRKIKDVTSSSGNITLQEDKVSSNGNSEAQGHKIHKRSPLKPPLIPPWFPFMYKNCALAYKAGSVLPKKILPVLGLAGPIGSIKVGKIAWPILKKSFLGVICPNLAALG